MKNLMVFVHPKKTFHKSDYHKENDFLIKVQIDNSLAWGWDRKDIIIATNFPFEYNGVKTVVIPDDVFSPKRKTVSKINAIIKLIDMGVITDESCWFHDLDAFQNDWMVDMLVSNESVYLTHTSVGDSRFSTGVMFFTKAAYGFFVKLQEICQEFSVNEETGLRWLLRKDPSCNLTVLNISYNFAIRKRNVAKQYTESILPIKVLHFHPTDLRPCSSEPTKSSLQVVYGENSLGVPLMGETLKGIFKQHGL